MKGGPRRRKSPKKLSPSKTSMSCLRKSQGAFLEMNLHQRGQKRSEKEQRKRLKSFLKWKKF